jgi:hypothetical protein
MVPLNIFQKSLAKGNYSFDGARTLERSLGCIMLQPGGEEWR